MEEVPRVLKLLKYPFTVSKNHLLNVGSPHSWPIRLGVLSWLVDCSIELDQDRTIDMMFPREHGFSDEGEFQIIKMMYGAFMVHGADSADLRELVEKREEAEKALYDRVTEEVARAREDNQAAGSDSHLPETTISPRQENTAEEQCDLEEDTMAVHWEPNEDSPEIPGPEGRGGANWGGRLRSTVRSPDFYSASTLRQDTRTCPSRGGE